MPFPLSFIHSFFLFCVFLLVFLLLFLNKFCIVFVFCCCCNQVVIFEQKVKFSVNVILFALLKVGFKALVEATRSRSSPHPPLSLSVFFLLGSFPLLPCKELSCPLANSLIYTQHILIYTGAERWVNAICSSCNWTFML